jgi:hypothetical protein
MGKVMDIFSMIEISLMDQVRNTLSYSGWVEKSDYKIKGASLEIKGTLAFEKIAKLLREVNFEIDDENPPIIKVLG